MLRALGLAVASCGVSHAQIERRLCERIAAGNRAIEILRDDPGVEDREALERWVARKRAVEESGLARTDGRRDKAGGQRIGELLAGKGDTMPSRRRVEVCVDVFLEVLEEKDPSGYAEGRYGTRRLWHELWLQADQRQMPKISETATTVLGYLDVALEQLAAAAGSRDGGGEATAARRRPVTRNHTNSATGAAALEEQPLEPLGAEAAEQSQRQLQEFAEELARFHQEARLKDQQLAAARAERDDALERARAAEEKAGSARRDVEQEIARVRAELASKTATNARLYRILAAVAALAIVAIAGGLILAVTGSPWAQPTRIVQLAALPQKVTSADQANFSFLPALPTGRDWDLTLQLRITPTDEAAGCTYGAQLTAQVEADGKIFPSFTSESGETEITKEVHLGRLGSRTLQLVVTRIATDPGCVLQLNTLGSVATATVD
jgi:hypothetical protein